MQTAFAKQHRPINQPLTIPHTRVGGNEELVDARRYQFLLIDLSHNRLSSTGGGTWSNFISGFNGGRVVVGIGFGNRLKLIAR